MEHRPGLIGGPGLGDDRKKGGGRAHDGGVPSFLMSGSMVIGTVLLVGALTFIPALALGPIVEHLVIWGG